MGKQKCYQTDVEKADFPRQIQRLANVIPKPTQIKEIIGDGVFLAVAILPTAGDLGLRQWKYRRKRENGEKKGSPLAQKIKEIFLKEIAPVFILF